MSLCFSARPLLSLLNFSFSPTFYRLVFFKPSPMFPFLLFQSVSLGNLFCSPPDRFKFIFPAQNPLESNAWSPAALLDMPTQVSHRHHKLTLKIKLLFFFQKFTSTSVFTPTSTTWANQSQGGRVGDFLSWLSLDLLLPGPSATQDGELVWGDRCCLLAEGEQGTREVCGVWGDSLIPWEW